VWWSPDHPQGKREDYAKINAICPEYNELEWVSQCTLKAGSIIAVGPTQSVKCKDGTEIPANPSLQIFVGNYPKDVVCEKTLIKTCGEPHKPDYKANASDIYNEVCAK